VFHARQHDLTVASVRLEIGRSPARREAGRRALTGNARDRVKAAPPAAIGIDRGGLRRHPDDRQFGLGMVDSLAVVAVRAAWRSWFPDHFSASYEPDRRRNRQKHTCIFVTACFPGQKLRHPMEQSAVVAAPSQLRIFTAPALPRSNQIDATLFDLMSQRQ
jgi:hypothetical protein